MDFRHRGLKLTGVPGLRVVSTSRGYATPKLLRPGTTTDQDVSRVGHPLANP
jgi:hypothetical protein